MTLRPYQISAVDELRAAFRHHRRVLLQAPTGAGKTVIFSWLAQAVAARGRSVKILAHRRELVRQASAKLTDAGVDHGIIDTSTRGVSRKLVNVASVQTLVRRLAHYPDDPDLIIVDEAHHAVAGTWAAVLRAYPRSKVLGVTATPERLDGKGLREAFDELVLGPSVRELILDGYLAEYVAYGPSGGARPDLTGVHTVAGDYNTAELARVMSDRRLIGDAVEHYRRYADGRPAVAFCVTVAHAEAVAAQFEAAGYRAASVDGTMDDALRDARIGGLADGSVQVLTSCALISEGLDVPGIGAAILLRPTKSLSMYLQQVGRALRPKVDGSAAVMLDHAGNMAEHGMPCDDRFWSLDGRPKKKKRRPNEIQVQTCFECYATVASNARTCPHCGAVLREPDPPPVADEGELVELRPSWYGDDGRPTVERTWRDIAGALSRCKDFKDINALAKALGFKPGWSHFQARALGWLPIQNGNGYTVTYVRRLAA